MLHLRCQGGFLRAAVQRVCLAKLCRTFLEYLFPLTCRERAAKEAFYEQQCSTGSGFLGMATTTLQLLNQLSADPAVKQSFLQEPLVHQAAYASIHFRELLVSSCVVPFPQLWSCWPVLPMPTFNSWGCLPACRSFAMRKSGSIRSAVESIAEQAGSLDRWH